MAKAFIAERLMAYKEGGGYIFGLDGPVGPGIGFEDYEQILEIVRTYGKY